MTDKFKFTVDVAVTKQTPGTVVYDNIDITDVPQTIYVRKERFTKGSPKKLRITVEEID